MRALLAPQRTRRQGIRCGTQLGTVFRFKLLDKVCSVGSWLEGMDSPLENICLSSVIFVGVQMGFLLTLWPSWS